MRLLFLIGLIIAVLYGCKPQAKKKGAPKLCSVEVILYNCNQPVQFLSKMPSRQYASLLDCVDTSAFYKRHLKFGVPFWNKSPIKASWDKYPIAFCNPFVLVRIENKGNEIITLSTLGDSLIIVPEMHKAYGFRDYSMVEMGAKNKSIFKEWADYVYGYNTGNGIGIFKEYDQKKYFNKIVVKISPHSFSDFLLFKGNYNLEYMYNSILRIENVYYLIGCHARSGDTYIGQSFALDSNNFYTKISDTCYFIKHSQ